MRMAEWNLLATRRFIDRDTTFVAVFEAEDVEIVRVGPAAPNLNAFAERWVRTLRQERLDYFVIVGERRLACLQ